MGGGSLKKKEAFLGKKMEIIQCVGGLPFLYINCITSKFINIYTCTMKWFQCLMYQSLTTQCGLVKITKHGVFKRIFKDNTHYNS